ncbi:hypothetical protein A4X13_0g4696 [Tilletia indica]|uniref:Uncharacterized protein n=1 Tax=Tilletia indica TaxID=43049 RepID=A0A177TQC0_9BASI|nr:hypothetical protein A4X13_0g4696 [Tilletia indica]
MASKKTLELNPRNPMVKELSSKAKVTQDQNRQNVLGDKDENVFLSSRMVDSPCVLVTGQFGWSANSAGQRTWSGS